MGRERWHKWLQESSCTPLQDRILEVQQRRGVPSRKPEHKTGTTVFGSDVAPAKRYFKVHWPNRSSFFPVDWHSDHHKKKKLVLTLNEIVNACLWISIFCTTKVEVVRHFLVGAAAWPRSRDHDVRARGQAHLDAILSLLALAQTSPISPHSLETDLYVRF